MKESDAANDLVLDAPGWDAGQWLRSMGLLVDELTHRLRKSNWLFYRNLRFQLLMFRHECSFFFK